MDHAEATRIQAPERYLHGELSPPEAEAFEEHYFCCPNCAEELTLEDAFAENVRAIYQARAHKAEESLRKAAPAARWWAPWSPGWAVPLAAAACLLTVIGVQNLVTIPHLRTEVAKLSNGEAPFTFPLTIARGNELVAVPSRSVFFMPYFYLPGGAAAGRYLCDIDTSAGARTKRISVPAPPAGQPLGLLLLRSEFASGTYLVKVRGDNAPEVIATYTMTLSNTN